jgi:broad specificity phosphatase PhoE
MPSALPKLYLARHGDTAWTDSRRHTGRTDVPLNERGEEHARQLGKRLERFSFVCVFTSPLQRASKTCELAGFGAAAQVDDDLIRAKKQTTGCAGIMVSWPVFRGRW